LPHSGKIVPNITKGYRNVLSVTGVCLNNSETIPKLISPHKRKLLHVGKISIFPNPAYVPPQKTRVVRFQTEQKIHENIRNSPSSLYCWSVKDPKRHVFEANGSTCKKNKLVCDTKICYFYDIFVYSSHQQKFACCDTYGCNWRYKPVAWRASKSHNQGSWKHECSQEKFE